MIQWELAKYTAFLAHGLHKFNVNDLDLKHPQTGKSLWDDLKSMAAQGWELVSVTPISGPEADCTTRLLYTFKRPKPQVES